MTRSTCPNCGMTSAHPCDAEEGYCGNCHAFTKADFLLDVAGTQERVVLVADRVVWEAHIQAAIGGTVVAVARPAGMEGAFEEHRWRLGDITDMARAEETRENEGADPLQEVADALAERARQERELPLAERLVREHLERGD